MIKKYYDQDCNLSLLDGKTVAIIGFGSQGHAHAMNLHESGVNVVVGLRPGSAHTAKAEAAGLKVVGIEEAAEAGDVVMILTPDELQASIYKNQIEKHMKEGNVLMFAHGFNIHFNQIKPAPYLDVIMVAPKGPGHTVRSQYVEGKGVPSLIAVYQDASGKAKDYALAYASGIGAGRAGILETTFKEETLRLCSVLKEGKIPYIFVDSDVPEAGPAASFTADQKACGKLAGKMLCLLSAAPPPPITERLNTQYSALKSRA